VNHSRPVTDSAVFLQALAGSAVAVLVMLGVGGVFYNAGSTLYKVLALAL
jgi:hypothetical protein